MGVTEIIRKQGPHLTPVVLMGLSFVLGNLSIALLPQLKEMQTKAKTTGLDWFDFSILLVVMMGSIFTNLGAYMNRRYSEYQDQKEEERKRIKQLTETEWIRQQTQTPPTQQKGQT